MAGAQGEGRGRQATGFGFVETIVAAVLAALLLALVGGALWSWNRERGRLERFEKAVSLLTARLDLLASLPPERRPEPGTYRSGEVEDPDLARVLEPRPLGGETVRLELVVEVQPVAYPDYFFGGKERIPFLDFRRHRLRTVGGGISLEMVGLR